MHGWSPGRRIVGGVRISRTSRLIAPFVAAALIAPLSVSHAAGGPATARPAPAKTCEPGSGWAPSTTRRLDPADSHHAYVGNGYLGVRVPPAGAGYVAPGALGEPEEKTGWPLYTPRYDGAFVSGLYAKGPKNTAERQAVAALPNWTGLDVTVGGETYGPRSKVSGYRQTLFLHCGFVRTSLTWTTAEGLRTDLVYDVLADRDSAHTGAVRLRMTPHWSGSTTVTDRVDGRGARRMTQTGGGSTGTPGTLAVSFRTDGTGVKGAVASTLRAPGRVGEAAHARKLSAQQSARFAVREGTSYEAVKYVGVDTSRTARVPRTAAVAASLKSAAHGWRGLFAAHTEAWRGLWSSRVDTPGRDELQLWLRSAQYGLLSATREGSRDSIAPTGLTSDNYAGMIFWDAETWMFPGLLATRPELARPVLDYRVRTMPAARANAAKLGFEGLFFPWTSSSEGDLWGECQSWDPPHCVTQNHLQGDIALAAWQYWLTTGDRGWLRSDGLPLLRGIAEFWASRVTANSDGSYSIKGVAGPDEYSNGVDDGVYTNAVAATALRHAASATEELGGSAPAAWRRIADGLRIPYDAKRKLFLQYAGYEGSRIKQADTVLLTYPLDWPMPKGAAAATLDYYAERTDPDGPAMTDSVHAIDAAAIDEPGCSTYTYLQRAVRPFVRGPFALFSEARGDKAGAEDPLSGSPAQDFLTGKGGFLQVFTHGLTGMRLRDGDALRLDPMLPPQLARGAEGDGESVTLRGLHWQGRTYDMAIGPDETTVRLTGGAPFGIDTPQGRFTVGRDAPAVLKTRRPDREPTADLARCRPVRATSQEPGLYAEAAVDGSRATVWSPDTDADTASLTVDLGTPTRTGRITPQWSARPASSRVETSADGRTWAAPGGDPVRWVRITVRTAEDAKTRPGLRGITVERAG